jgi:hypothetical protein
MGEINMVLEAILSSVGIDSVKSSLKGALNLLKAKTSKTKYKLFLSTALRELLNDNPDISLAEANILAAEATGVQPSAELIRTKDILNKVKRHTAKKAKKKPAKKVAKKAPKKKVAKAPKKKVAKKTAKK